MAGIDFIHQNGIDYEIVPEIAPLFKTTVAYHTGDHVIYDAKWYTFKADKAAGAWDATKVNGPFEVADQLTNLKEDLTATNAELADVRVGADGVTYESAGAAVRGQINDVRDDLNDISDVVYPNQDVLLKATSTDLPNINSYWNTTALTKNHKYRIVLSFSGDPIRLANIRTSRSESGSGNVDVITNDFNGDSWVDGKTCIYEPQVDGITYLQIQFNSAYSGDLSMSFSVYDYGKEQEPVTVNLQSEIDEKQDQIDALKYEVNLDVAYNLLPPDGYEVGKYISVDGSISSDSALVLSDYIEIDQSQGYICNWTKTVSVINGNSAMTGNVNTFSRFNFCFFDENKNVVPFTGDTASVSKEIPDGAKYIRVTILSVNVYPLARLIYGNFQTQPIVRIVDYKKTQQKKYESPNTGFEDFKMVMFGDSITHGSLSATDDGISYVNYANDYLHSNIVNVGFGGTRMTYTLTGAGLFCFYHLCECIVSDDPNVWDDLIAYATNENVTYMPHLQALMNMDWSTVKAIGLMYGANDYTSNTPVGSAYNETITNFDGACAYGLKLLLTKYPHLQVLILSPFDREMTVDNPDTMTDRQQNTAGLLMSNYGDALENVVSRLHCKLVRTDKAFSINQYNITTYAPDGTHPRANIAQKRLGWLFAQVVKNNLAPF